jgi:hypothetical protein
MHWETHPNNAATICSAVDPRCAGSLRRLPEATITTAGGRAPVAASGIAALQKIPKPPARRSFASGIFRKAALRHFLREASVNCAPYIKFPAVPLLDQTLLQTMFLLFEID